MDLEVAADILSELISMIPHSWLRQRLETTDVSELSKRELEKHGLSVSDKNKVTAVVPTARWLAKWHAFVGRMTDGDELWYFESPAETWAGLSGAAGYALVRSGQIIDSLTSRRS